jgi:HAD superfamily hydrolase (TIGR01509 family)
MTTINPNGPAAPLIPKGVILDMDGLMLDTERLETDLYVEISAKMGWPTPRTMLRKTIGVKDADALAFYKNEYGADYPFNEIWDAVVKEEEMRAIKNGLPHKKGLLVLLDKLKSLSVPLALATSADSKRAQWKLERAGILDRFKVFACGDEVKQGKPAPDIFLLAAKKLGVEPEGCIGFEDSPAGLAGLASAGIPSVFIKDLADPPPETLATVWRQCSDLEEAATLFE